MPNDLAEPLSRFEAFNLDDAVVENLENTVGRGFNTLTQAVLPTMPVEREMRLQPYRNVGQQAKYEVITNRRQLRDFLGIKVSGKGSYGAGSFKARAEYYHERKENYRSVVLAISIVARQYSYQLFKNYLSVEYIRSVQGRDENSVHEQFGDSYVAEALYGAELLILLEYSFENRFDLERFKLDVSAKYGSTKGGISISKERELVSVFSRAKLTLLESGVNPTTQDHLSYEDDRGVAVNVDALLGYAEGFALRAAQDEVPSVLEVRTAPIKQTQNWAENLPELDVDEVYETVRKLSGVLDELTVIRGRWAEVQEHIGHYLLDEENLEGESQKISEKLSQLERAQNAITDAISVQQRAPFTKTDIPTFDLADYVDLPSRKPVMIPVIRTKCYQVKRDPSSGSGQAPNRIKNYEVDPDNPRNEKHWFPNHSGGRLEIVEMQVRLDPRPVGLDIKYKVKLSGQSGIAEGIGGTNISGGYFHAIAFELVGPMADAYFIEYQAHAGNKRGDTIIGGNTPNANVKQGEMIGSSWQFEGIRLAIFPKIPIA